MVHYTCDSCKRSINPQIEPRYIVRLEVYAPLDPMDNELDDDRDHLQEIQDILENLDDVQDEQLGVDVYQQQRFDLCGDCRRRYLQNPLGRLPAHHMDFSQN